MKNTPYYIVQSATRKDKIQYLFASEGKKTIIKTIEYSPAGEINGRTVFNLGFGDFDETTGEIVDDVNSNNGDIYIVFNTVLHTVPIFFDKYPTDVIIVSGSDSKNEFAEVCKLTCEKKTKCKDKCHKIDRRIKTYRYYVDKNYAELCKEYVIFGNNNLSGIGFVPYVPYDDYHDILVYKK